MLPGCAMPNRQELNLRYNNHLTGLHVPDMYWKTSFSCQFTETTIEHIPIVVIPRTLDFIHGVAKMNIEISGTESRGGNGFVP
jgi:hypothetical protein